MYLHGAGLGAQGFELAQDSLPLGLRFLRIRFGEKNKKKGETKGRGREAGRKKVESVEEHAILGVPR